MQPAITRGSRGLVITVVMAAVGVPTAASGHLGAPAARAGAPTTHLADAGRSDMLLLNFRGKAQREQTPEAQRFQWTADLYSMATGQKVGTGTHNVEFITPFIGDHVMTFRLAQARPT